MSWTDLIIFFLSLFFTFFSVSTLNMQFIKSTVRANNLYATFVITACQDALEMELSDSTDLSDDSHIQGKDMFWKDYEIRENAVNTFYHSLGLSLNKTTDAYYNEIELMTPVICLIDYDGFYISYNAAFDDTAVTSDDNDNLHAITQLNTWAENVGNYTVRYYLTDDVTVYCHNGKQYYGDRKEVFQDIYAETSDTTLQYLADDEEFDLSRNACVIQHIDEQVEYYINNHNLAADGYDTLYSLNMTENSGETWTGMIDNPTILAFIQGPTYNIRQKKVSVYGLGAYEYDEQLHYFISTENDMMYYRCYEEELWKNRIHTSNGKIFYNGLEVTRFYTCAQDCAKEGAYPALD